MGVDAGGLANLFLAAQGVNAAAGVANSYVQSQALRSEGKYARQTAEEDALMRELQIRDVKRAGDRAAALRGLETRQLIGRQRAAAAGQGVDVSSASVQALAEEAAMFGALDAEAEMNNAWRAAWGLKAEAAQVRRAGRNARDAANFQARMSAVSGGLQAGRDLLQGAYGYSQFREWDLGTRASSSATSAGTSVATGGARGAYRASASRAGRRS